MTRRTFLGAIAALGGRLRAGGASAVLAGDVAQAGRKNWVWMRPRLDRTADDWKREFGAMRAAGIHAIVTENIYDSVSGRFLLVPQGSRLVGKYDNVVAFGQERALVI